MYKAGIDVGSTTVKMVVFDDHYEMIFSRYERHFSDVKSATIKVLKDMITELGDVRFTFSITGSGGMGLSDVIGATFIQEVIASTLTIEKFIPPVRAARVLLSIRWLSCSKWMQQVSTS